MKCNHLRTTKRVRTVRLPRDRVRYTIKNCLDCKRQVSVITCEL